MIEKKVIIKNESGLHARPAAKFVKECSKYRSEIAIEKEGFKINAKSIMGIMAIGIFEGDEITISIDGPDEGKAMEEIVELLEKL